MNDIKANAITQTPALEQPHTTPSALAAPPVAEQRTAPPSAAAAPPPAEKKNVSPNGPKDFAHSGDRRRRVFDMEDILRHAKTAGQHSSPQRAN